MREVAALGCLNGKELRCPLMNHDNCSSVGAEMVAVMVAVVVAVMVVADLALNPCALPSKQAASESLSQYPDVHAMVQMCNQGILCTSISVYTSPRFGLLDSTTLPVARVCYSLD
jgi:hypothetical protein